MCALATVVVRGRHSRFSSPLLLCGDKEPNAGPQTSQEAPSHNEPSHLPVRSGVVLVLFLKYM